MTIQADNRAGQGTRLNKYLAHHMGLSRRAADQLITQGRVMVDGVPARLGSRLAPGQTPVVDGRPIAAVDRRYVALHKPAGFVCSRRQQGNAPTVYSLLPADLADLKPVGRLDRDSSGLLLLSNDGDFAQRMTHPRFGKVKQYQVRLDQPLAPLHQQMISDYGIALADGPSRFRITRADHPADPPTYHVTLAEGRNRQIRRTFAALGYTVTWLHRTSFGPYHLGTLAEGAWQTVTGP